ncbi:30S ribosomal protein S24e [Methanomicrobium antiquum]|uniref:Small ribosomal subunit protein eS24 n=1 Tax=Methanomicrobium antiquum TaxID=487686 RepID=A0AAF0FWZ1_9EURY|nr:30S ribosomal protein S24e [Methanomicrobium antiquum]MDD3977987.1 30S ribosomal protein S24e [Methanomicrobium sp.]WFN36559.1 30S ribosomal protein S24e [Methanomicrobium antiquum]
MDFEFIRDEENKLLNRTELDFVLKYEGATPSRKEIMGKLCALRNVNMANCVVDSLEGEFGKQEIVASARIYENVEDLKATELDYIVKRCHAEEEKSEEAEA